MYAQPVKLKKRYDALISDAYSQDRLCANLRTNMTSQCEYQVPCVRVNVVPPQCLVRKKKVLATMAQSAIENCFSGYVRSGT